MSETVRNLFRLRRNCQEPLVLAVDHAIALAREAEYTAEHASQLAQTGIPPVYPPLVAMLADAGREVEA